MAIAAWRHTGHESTIFNSSESIDCGGGTKIMRVGGNWISLVMRGGGGERSLDIRANGGETCTNYGNSKEL